MVVCDEWLNSFEAFHNWAMESGYHEKLTIDRIDGDGNYEPSNCRWVTRTVQSVNRTYSNTQTGHRGIRFSNDNPNIFRATIKVRQKSIHLGTFHLLEDAIAARKEAELKYFGI